MSSENRVWSYIFTFTFTFVLLSFLIVPQVSAESQVDASNSENLSEYEDTNVQHIKLTENAKVSSDRGEIGLVSKNMILPVEMVNEGLYEIIIDFQVNNRVDERLFLEFPLYEEVSKDSLDSIEKGTDAVLVEETLTYAKGIRLKSIHHESASTVSLETSVTFPFYYQLGETNIIKWKDEYYYVEPWINKEVPSETTTPESNLNDNKEDKETQAKKTEKVETVLETSGVERKAMKSSIKSPAFKESDKYFQVLEEIVPVYDNSGDSLRPVGYLTKGQVYPRVSDYGDWHQIRYGDKFGYIWKAATTPASGNAIMNENKVQKNMSLTFKGVENLTVYDNTSGALVPFGRINKGEKYPMLGKMGDWIRVDFSGRTGYVYGPSTAMEFKSNDKYFKVLGEVVPVYDNSGGSLRAVGYLTKDQVYPRVSDYGDWHQIKYGNKYGYVWEAATTPASGSAIRNENTGKKNMARTFKAKEMLTVYDNTSGALIPFGRINQNERYPLIGIMGDWIQVDFSGRSGYVYGPSAAMEFKSGDKYFKVLEEAVPVYDNSSSSSRTVVGYLTKGQVFPRVSDYGDWHQIKFGHQYGYVSKASTTLASGNEIRNENKNSKDLTRTFKVLRDLEVFDNSGGTLVSFARIKAGEIYPIISDYGSDWYEVDFSGRIGYVYKLDKRFIQTGPIIEHKYTNYNYSLANFLSDQMKVTPQTDLYRNLPAYISKEYVEYLDDEKHPPGYYVTATALNVREAPNSKADTFIYGTLKQGTKVTIVEEAGGWYRILYTWRNAKREDTVKYLNPNSNTKYQHLRLDVSTDISSKELNNILIGKGILEGKGQAFKEASQKFQINEAYLISHALLETGNGTSTLATGVPIKVTNGLIAIVDPLKETPEYTVFNMYGVGAKDSCPLQCGAQTAYDEGWFTPTSAIIGGAKFIDSNYIKKGQNTLYKMRWNPDFAVKNGFASHQYATDIGWAVKQAQEIEEFYNRMNFYSAIFDVPAFK